MTDRVVRLPPATYIHVHDSNTNITSLVVGPTTYTVSPHQVLQTVEPQPFVVIPPEHFALIANPVKINPATKKPLTDRHGQVVVALGEREYRFQQLPFPLYPQEVVSKLEKITSLKPGENLVVKATTKFEDFRAGATTTSVSAASTGDSTPAPGGAAAAAAGAAAAAAAPPKGGIVRNAGDEWLCHGPGLYIPRVEEDVVERRDATVVKEGESLLLKARNRFVDPTTKQVREVGEEYLYATPGQYTVGVHESLIRTLRPTILTRQKALHVSVKAAFKDTRSFAKGVQRLPGQVYLVTADDCAEFTPFPGEQIVKEVNLVTLTKKRFAIILDPVENGVQQLGRRKIVTQSSFFLRPGERMQGGVLDMYVLSQDEALHLKALDEFTDTDSDSGAPVLRKAGDQWLLRGPKEYIPSASVQVCKDKKGKEIRTKIVLADGEGVYVRNTVTGEVRTVIATTYMLAAQEELWEKDLPAVVEEKLARQGNSVSSYMEGGVSKAGRDKTKVVRFQIPHNAVTQVYDYKKRTQRTIFGPGAVLLGPEEQFTVLSLSGSDWDPARPQVCLPKQTDKIKALYLYLGPASLSDVLQVETADHARLSLQLSYEWYFDVLPGRVDQADECFKVPDFVGDCCSCIASRVRATIAATSFDNFHKNSASIVRNAVFGSKPLLKFPSNRLVVTSVDIQEIEVMDEKTRTALQQSVKMAIEITTQAQEAVARQEASVREQQAKGKLERQQIADKSSNEVVRKTLLECETASNAIATTGQAKAEAKARANAADIEGDTSVKIARKRATTATLMDATKDEVQKQKTDLELENTKAGNDIEVHYESSLATIESDKFKQIMTAVGPNTIAALARAGPELQAKMLKSLGLEGFLVTDGTHPINLFTTAKGMTAPQTAPK